MDLMSYQQKKQTRDLTVRKDRQLVHRDEDEATAEQIERWENRNLLKRLKSKTQQETAKGCHGQQARPPSQRIEMEDLMGQKIKAESS